MVLERLHVLYYEVWVLADQNEDPKGRFKDRMTILVLVKDQITTILGFPAVSVLTAEESMKAVIDIASITGHGHVSVKLPTKRYLQKPRVDALLSWDPDLSSTG